MLFSSPYMPLSSLFHFQNTTQATDKLIFHTDRWLFVYLWLMGKFHYKLFVLHLRYNNQTQCNFKKIPYRILRLTLSNNKLKVLHIISGSCFMQPVGNGFVILYPYWLFSSNFNIFIITLFVVYSFSLSNLSL